MTTQTPLSRRAVLGGVSAAALMPGLSVAQTPPRFEEFAARARTVSGFDSIPRAVLTGVHDALAPPRRTAFAAGHGASEEVTKTVLHALYTGIHTPRDGPPQRLGYAQALMYAAIQDAVNVPSYCGGVPGYWAETPSAV